MSGTVVAPGPTGRTGPQRSQSYSARPNARRRKRSQAERWALCSIPVILIIGIAVIVFTMTLLQGRNDAGVRACEDHITQLAGTVGEMQADLRAGKGDMADVKVEIVRLREQTIAINANMDNLGKTIRNYFEESVKPADRQTTASLSR